MARVRRITIEEFQGPQFLGFVHPRVPTDLVPPEPEEPGIGDDWTLPEGQSALMTGGEEILVTGDDVVLVMGVDDA